MSIERQELHCHACSKYVQFDVDMEENGNLVLECPNCGHEHCRIIKDGKITEGRWDQRNPHNPSGASTIIPTSINWTNNSTYTVYMGATNGNEQTTTGNNYTGNVFTYQSWMNASSAT